MDSNNNNNEVAAAAASVAVTVGYVSAILSAIFNGSFSSGFKLQNVASCHLHPVWFTVYVSLGVIVSSFVFGFLLLPWNDWAAMGTAPSASAYEFEPLGLVAGSLFLLAIAFSFAAIDHIGVALSQGLWSGGAIIVSFLWGTLGFDDYIQSTWIAVLALFLLMLGVMMIAFCERISAYYTKTNVEQQQPEEIVTKVEEMIINSNDGDREKSKKKNRWIGFICALTVGLFGGSILVPLHYVPSHRSGFVFLPSFGIGVLVASPIVAIVWLFFLFFNEPKPASLHREEETSELKQPTSASLHREEETSEVIQPQKLPPFWQRLPKMHLHPCLWVGMMSGMIWNFNNILAIIAIPRIGYAIAYPIAQCALFVSGLLGIFVFNEIQNRASISVFFMGGLVLLCGAILLSVNSSGSDS